MSTGKFLIIVGGATASGKTGFAIRLAQHFQTEILSLDSRQFYQEMEIGTARPTEEELAAAPHHFVGHISIHQAYSVGDFVREALVRLDRLFKQYDVVIASGGSGLYIKGLCEGLDEFPVVPPAIKENVMERYESEGLSALQDELQQLDPTYHELVDLNNPHRLIRAISVCRASGAPFSSFLKKGKASRIFTPIYLQMHWPRRTQYDRINQRVDLMIAAGQVQEVRKLYKFRTLTALQTVGYKELFEFVEEKATLAECIEKIKRNTRRYAKRQLTWFRRDGIWKHIHPSEWDLALAYIEYARKSGLSLVPATEEEKAGLCQALQSTVVSDIECNQVSFLLGKSQDSIRVQVPYLQNKKEVLILPVPDGTADDPNLVHLLLHEVVARAEDRTIYCLTSSESQPKFAKSFKKVEATQLPTRLQKWLSQDYQVWQLNH